MRSMRWQRCLVAVVSLAGCYTDVELDPSEGGPDGDADADADSDSDPDLDGNCTWDVEVVDPNYGAGVAVATAPDGSIHVTYYDDHSVVHHASNETGDWIVEVVDEDGSQYGSTALGIDDSGRAHLAYPVSGSRDGAKWDGVRYATSDGGAWTTQEVADGSYPALALDADGGVHVSQYDYRGHIVVSTNRTGDWTQSPITLGGDSNGDSSLVVAADGVRHVAFNEYLDGELWLGYATDEGGDWTIDTVSSGGVINSVALDSDGAPLIAFEASIDSPTEIWFARPTGAEWALDKIDGDGSPFQPALLLDADGRAHVIYCAQVEPALLHATSTDDGWSLERVEMDWCQYARPVLDAVGLRVAFQCDEIDRSVCLATRTCD